MKTKKTLASQLDSKKITLQSLKFALQNMSTIFYRVQVFLNSKVFWFQLKSSHYCVQKTQIFAHYSLSYLWIFEVFVSSICIEYLYQVFASSICNEYEP